MKNTKINGKLRKIITPVVIAVICAGFLTCDTSLSEPPLLGSSTDTKSWMSRLPDDWYITRIAIPGTHDSATWQSSFADSTVRCQERDFMAQLNEGIRYFDFRLGSGKIFDTGGSRTEELRFFHGPFYLGVTLEDAMRTFKTFMDAHPTETILVQVTPETDDDNFAGKNFAQRFREQTYEHGDYRHLWYTGTGVPTLGQVRGRIVLVRNYSGSTVGIDLYSVKSRRENTTWGGMSEHSPNLHIQLQDHFDISGHATANFDSDVAKKKDYIKDLIIYAINCKGYETISNLPHDLNLNFWSHSWALGTSPQGYAGAINRYMRDNKMFTTRVPSVQLMDFYWTENVNDIIASNFIGPASGGFTIYTGGVTNGRPGDSVVRLGGGDDDINSQRNRSTNWKLDITMSYGTAVRSDRKHQRAEQCRLFAFGF